VQDSSLTYRRTAFSLNNLSGYLPSPFANLAHLVVKSGFMITEQEALHWIAELFELSADKIRPETAREAIPAWDSLGVLTLMAALDERFGIVLSDADMQVMSKVDDILSVLRGNGKIEKEG
jgi:acyl carrier protein